MKRIIVDHGVKKELMRILGCTYPTMKTALAFESNTPLAKKIRKTALEKGGKEFNNQ